MFNLKAARSAIKAIKNKRGLTKQQLMDEIGIGYNTLHNIIDEFSMTELRPFTVKKVQAFIEQNKHYLGVA
jgi:hypothetical protein